MLLDELGAGTDPTEGSALAQALLDHFIAAGALVAATTHYAELKAYAHNTPAAENASVEFDLETLSPDLPPAASACPGTSQAFAIAERLGLPDALVADARSRLGQAQEEFERTLASIKEAQQTAEESLARAAEAEERARAARREAEDERSRRAARARGGHGRRPRGGAARAGRGPGRDRRRARAAGANEPDRGAARGVGRATRGARSASLARDARRDAAAEPVGGRAPPRHRGWRARCARRDGWQGTVAEIDERAAQATIAAGSLRISVPLDDLTVVGGPAPVHPRRDDQAAGASGHPDEPGPARRARRRGAGAARYRTSTRRQSPERPRVTVIHGHGSGALRDALRAQLERPSAGQVVARRRARRRRRRSNDRRAVASDDPSLRRRGSGRFARSSGRRPTAEEGSRASAERAVKTDLSQGALEHLELFIVQGFDE